MKQKRWGAAALAMSIGLLLTACGASGGDSSAPSVGEDAPAAQDMLAQTSWTATNDGSQIVFSDDGTFAYYRSADDHSDSYYTGTYVFNMGQDAMDYLLNDLADYSVSEEEMQNVFEGNESYDLENLVCLVLNNETCMVGGENTLEETVVTPYFGFSLQDNTYLDVANMNSGAYYAFTLDTAE